jgi:tetratricopeptide (TPR) repeat protein
MTEASGGWQTSKPTRQEVRAENGFAYGVIGADIHVFGDGTPLYLLFAHRPPQRADSRWLVAQPSRMLDARAQVVEFTGREAELTDLITWRDSGVRWAVRWLHGPGGQGKTRLTAELAARSEAIGWKVVEAVHGTDTHPPAEQSQDLRMAGHIGILLLVDYADRWPVSHLSWLFRNSLFRSGVPIRVLLLARSTTTWPAIKGKIHRLREQADVTDQWLAPLAADDPGGARHQMFESALRCFAGHYGRPFPLNDLIWPTSLHIPEFGLVLAVHMAALATIDAHVYGRTLPAGLTGLTVYLLEREHENWQQLYENQIVGLAYRTDGETMARTAFFATLIGPTRRAPAKAILQKWMRGRDVDQILDDHAVCYPPADPDSEKVFAPIVPDRLAEDFIALTVPGHDHVGYPVIPSADVLIVQLLTSAGNNFATFFLSDTPKGWQFPPYAPRILTTLAAAADRWPHLMDVLHDLHGNLPIGPHATLDAAALSITERLAVHHMNAGSDNQTHWCDELIARLRSAGRDAEVLEYTRKAIDLHSTIGDQTDDEHLAAVAMALSSHAIAVADTGDNAAARECSDQALALAKQIVSDEYLPDLANILLNHANRLSVTGSLTEAMETSAMAVRCYEKLLETDRSNHLAAAAACFENHAGRLGNIGRRSAARQFYKRSLSAYRELAEVDLQAQLHNLARSTRQAAYIRVVGVEQAAEYADISVALNLVLAAIKGETSLPNLADAQWYAAVTPGTAHGGLSAVCDAITIYQKAITSNPHRYTKRLHGVVETLIEMLTDLKRHEEATEIRHLLSVGDLESIVRFAESQDGVGIRLALSATDARYSQAAAWNHLGSTLMQARWFVLAGLAYQHQLDLEYDLGDRHSAAAVENCIGSVLLELGQTTESIQAHIRSIDLYTQADDRGGQCKAWNNLGLAQLANHQHQDAVCSLRQSVKLGDHVGDEQQKATSRRNYRIALRRLYLWRAIRPSRWWR